MNKETADFGALAIKTTGTAQTRGGHNVNDVVPVGKQANTGKRIEFRLVGQNQGHARHAWNADNTLIRAMYNRDMINGVEISAERRLDAAETLQEIYQATGNRPQTCASYSPAGGEGHAESTPQEMEASLKYHAAIDSMSNWEWLIVRRVLIDDQMVDGLDLQHLVSGLDKLARHLGK